MTELEAPPSQQVLELVRKYTRLLGVTAEPHVVVQDNVGSRWLGRTVWAPHKDPSTTTIQLQRIILEHPRTLERVIAHEVIHHVEFVTMPPEDFRRYMLGVRRPFHGESFRKLAQVVNDAVDDPEFVTETSDQSYVLSETRRYLVLIVDVGQGRLGYAYGVKLSPQMQKAAKYVMQTRSGRLAYSTDRRWSRGPRIGSHKFAIPIEPEDQEALRALYASAAAAAE